jgi:hypothetical protein
MSSTSGLVQVGFPARNEPSLFGFVSAAQLEPQFGTAKKSTFWACGMKSS